MLSARSQFQRKLEAQQIRQLLKSLRFNVLQFTLKKEKSIFKHIIMAYLCEIETGQTIYLDNQGNQTIITTLSSSRGQQQQSSSGFQTGSWTSTPEVFRTSNGIIIKITTANSEYFWQVQGNSIGVMNNTPPLNNDQQLQLQQVSSTPTSSMPSMKPMKMGDMEMNMNPMQMRMGNMEMQMGATSSTVPTKQYCSQCGAKVKASDRFCASCGHQLS